MLPSSEDSAEHWHLVPSHRECCWDKKNRPMMPSRWVNFVDHLIFDLRYLKYPNHLICSFILTLSMERPMWHSTKRSLGFVSLEEALCKPFTCHTTWPKDLSCHSQITPSIGYGRPTTIGCLYPVPLKINRKPGINHPPTWGLHGCSTFFSANSDDTRLPGSIWLSDAPVPGVSLPNEDLHGALASSEAT